jgi:hypothetical protein
LITRLPAAAGDLSLLVSRASRIQLQTTRNACANQALERAGKRAFSSGAHLHQNETRTRAAGIVICGGRAHEAL